MARRAYRSPKTADHADGKTIGAEDGSYDLRVRPETSGRIA